LDTLADGDEVVVFYNQKKYIYRATDRAVVKPGDMDVLNSRDPNKKELALMTCWPIGTTLERIILFFELVEPGKEKEADTDKEILPVTLSGATATGITQK
jgi:LPXTG-site transpeptidase (sortase) family protein